MKKTDFAKGNDAFLKSNYSEAIGLYKKAINNNEKLFFYYENLALTYQKIDDFKNSNIHFRKSLCWNPLSQRSLNEIKKKNKKDLEDKTRPLLSIIVPVHNTEKYLSKCIKSILNQTLRDFELIIINDGSSDQSLNIIQKFMEQDKRIKLINNQVASGNPGTPRNQAIKVATGHYLGFVDSDDWIDENMYQDLTNSAIKNNSDMVFSGGFKNFLNGVTTERVYDNTYFNNVKSKYFKYHESFMIWDKIYKTDLINTFNIRLGETKAAVDVPFIFKAYYYLHNTSFCDTLVAYNYRRESDTSVTVNFRKGSSCDFELEAFHGVENWANKEKMNSNYKNLVKIKKLTSYIYTLKVIDPNMFESFYSKVQKEISTIDRNIIEEFTSEAKKRYILKTYDDICKLDAHSYQIKYREEYIEPTYKIDNIKKGILFFPEWTWSSPYQKLLYTALSDKYKINAIGYKPEFFNENILKQNRSKCDFIHLHWLHSFMDLTKETGSDEFFRTIKFAKSLGYKIIYTAHNIISHDSVNKELELKFRKRLIKEFDYILVHGEFAKNKIIKEINAEPSKVFIIEHGVYGTYYQNKITRGTAREHFNLKNDEFTFLFLGNIKGYKGVEPLIESFEQVSKKHSGVKLIIAGKVVDEYSKNILDKASEENKNIIYRPGFVKDDDLQLYFKASDIIILPYKNILTSGAALLSMTFEKPIIAPNTGLLPELITEKQGYLFNTFDEMTSIMNNVVTNFDIKNFQYKQLNNDLKWSNIVKKQPFNNMFVQ